MKGYKVFNPDWTCRGFQFEVGKVFEEDVKPTCCNIGFHFCTKASDCFNYYSFDPDNKVAEVEALGDIDTHSDDSKRSTNKLHIIREITWQEVLELVNQGKACTGFCNSGDRNSGDWNSGDWNSGNRNSGNRNSGDCNSGDCNSGDRNSGDCNSGDWNSGDWNSGDWNETSFVVGCFNTEQHQLLFFDRPTPMTYEQWRNSEACWLLNRIDFRPTEWVYACDMTDLEKKINPDWEFNGGYLKVRDNTNCCTEWWEALSESQKNTIKQIPNFDAEKFFNITGVQVN